MRGAPLSLRALTKRYGEVVAVHDFSLDVAAGEFVSLLGQSGSGKTTVLRLVAGLESPSSGDLEIDGQAATGLPPEKRQIGMVFQDYALFPHMSVRRNIAFPLRMRGLGRAEADERVREAMDLVNLPGLGHRRPHELSGGQQQRVALARALVFGPKVLLLDEPLSALDKSLREYMKAELQALHRRVGVTVLYVTHDQSEALALSDRVVVMRDGRIEGVDRPGQLYTLPATRYIAGFIGDANLLDGEIVGVSSGAVRISCALAAWEVPRARVRLDREPAAGSPVTVVVRPEFIALAEPAGNPDDNVRVSCDVVQALYGGASTTYVLKARDTGITLTARSEAAIEARPPAGGTVDATILTRQSVVVERA